MQIAGSLHKIQRAVQRAEKQFMQTAATTKTWPGGWASFPTQGIRTPSYAATPPSLMFRHLRQINTGESQLLKPDLHFADLGSGLGMASFTAAQYFEHVTGFEIDPRLSAAAEQIRQQFRIRNIEFWHMDFIKADLSEFDVIYFYHPFIDDFDVVMADKLSTTTPGTIIIVRSFTNQRIFPPTAFERFYPSSGESSEDNRLTNFFAYLRR